MHISSLNTLNNLVVGENGNAFAAGSWNFFETPRLVSFNLASGTPNWTYDSPFHTDFDPGYVDIVAAGPNNSLYATEGEFFNQISHNAFTLDASGTRTDNPTSSQTVTSVTSAGIGSNTWLGSNMPEIASVAGFDLGFGMPLILQSAPLLPQPGVIAYAATLVEPILSTYARQHPNGAEDPTGNFRLVPYSDCRGGTRQRHIIYNVLDLSKKPVDYPSGFWYVSEHQTNKCLIQPGCSGISTDQDFYFFDDLVGGGLLPGGNPVESKQSFTVAKLSAKPPAIGPLPPGVTSYRLFVRVPGTNGLLDSDVADYEVLGIFLGDIAFVQGLTSYPRIFQKLPQGGGTVLSGKAVCTNP